MRPSLAPADEANFQTSSYTDHLHFAGLIIRLNGPYISCMRRLW